nr:hypothetical protein [Candidatus Sigynarchaeum springense]MDO8119317.1 hypothetical protein [Candidatus Sigynarchaeota archaeon]
MVKLVMLIFMGVKIRRRRKEGLELAVNFLRAMWFLIFTFFLSRLLYMWFDFGLTHFDKAIYHLYVNWWKVAQLIVSIGLAVLVFVVDRSILGFKFKGIFAYIIIAGSILTLLWPVYSETDFDTISTIGILPQLGLLIVLIVFLNIAIKTSGRVRRTAFIIIFASIMYAVAALVVNAGIITALKPVFGDNTDVLMYAIQSILKATGIIMMAVGAARWGS